MADMDTTPDKTASGTTTAVASDEPTYSKNPNLDLAQLRFLLKSSEFAAEHADAKAKLLEAIEADAMAPFYKELCEEFKWDVDQALVKRLEASNEAEIAKLDATIADAKENEGEAEVQSAYQAKAEHLCRIGNKELAVAALSQASEHTYSVGQRMDAVFQLIRLGLFYGDAALTKKSIEQAESLLEQGGDWDRRNRLKVYKGTFSLTVRDFASAAKLFLETVSTFTSTELMEYSDFITLTVLTAMIALERPTLKSKVVKGPEIQETLHENEMIKQFLKSLHDCNYAQFFKSLASVETLIKRTRLMAPHCRYYVREMRLKAYTQQLASYRSMTLASMALSFGVSESFVDQDLSRFIASGRINCKIDKVGGTIETNRPDQKNAQYQSTIKQGDVLLNRIQKLSQLISI